MEEKGNELSELQSNKRDHKIEITDVAISKVPLVRYKEIPESDTDSMHLLRTAGDCILVLVHNHPSLSKISLQDISFMLRYETVKMVVVVTNRGSINYVVKSGKFNWDKASDMMIAYGNEYLKNDDLKHRQKVTDDFLSHCHECGFLYADH